MEKQILKHDESRMHQAFDKMLELYLEDNTDELDSYYLELNEQDIIFEVDTDEQEEWEESEIEGYSRFPTVTQECKLLLGFIVVARWRRQFGIEMIDPTHTGLAGDWSPFRLDENECDDIEMMLEYLDIEIIDPDVPPPQP